MSIITTVDDLRSKASELKLLDILNITAFNITTYVTTNDLPDKENTGDFVEINGKISIIVSHTVNHYIGSTSSWIWDHGRELRLFVG
jgi:hypothetical protein